MISLDFKKTSLDSGKWKLRVSVSKYDQSISQLGLYNILCQRGPGPGTDSISSPHDNPEIRNLATTLHTPLISDFDYPGPRAVPHLKLRRAVIGPLSLCRDRCLSAAESALAAVPGRAFMPRFYLTAQMQMVMLGGRYVTNVSCAMLENTTKCELYKSVTSLRGTAPAAVPGTFDSIIGGMRRRMTLNLFQVMDPYMA